MVIFTILDKANCHRSKMLLSIVLNCQLYAYIVLGECPSLTYFNQMIGGEGVCYLEQPLPAIVSVYIHGGIGWMHIVVGQSFRQGHFRSSNFMVPLYLPFSMTITLQRINVMQFILGWGFPLSWRSFYKFTCQFLVLIYLSMYDEFCVIFRLRVNQMS